MKLLAIVRDLLICFAMLMIIAHEARAQGWTGGDVGREAVFAGVLTMDWAQTRYIAVDRNCWENNPMIGRHPSVGRVNLIFAGAEVAHIAVTSLLPRAWRPTWQYTTIAVETTLVAHNAAIGIRMRF